MSNILLIVCDTILREVEETSVHDDFKHNMIRCIITDGSKKYVYKYTRLMEMC